MKHVIYNGGNESYIACTPPTKLINGNIYTVVSEQVEDYFTTYKLLEVEGNFNSAWFDEFKPTEFAVSHNLPVVGKRYSCTKLNISQNRLSPTKIETDTVISASVVGNCVFKVDTKSKTYFVTVK